MIAWPTNISSYNFLGPTRSHRKLSPSFRKLPSSFDDIPAPLDGGPPSCTLSTGNTGASPGWEAFGDEPSPTGAADRFTVSAGDHASKLRDQDTEKSVRCRLDRIRF
jgi:hypothetical protein